MKSWDILASRLTLSGNRQPVCWWHTPDLEFANQLWFSTIRFSLELSWFDTVFPGNLDSWMAGWLASLAPKVFALHEAEKVN